jgi:predicted kinase
MLYIFGGLPATGKSELSKYLASSIGAVYIRIDTIEQELRNVGFKNLYDEGYKIAFSTALDNLRNGLSVVADSTNPVVESRQAWISIAKQAEAPYTEIEIICSNTSEHRSRVESRKTDIPNLVLPNWESVISREYQLWHSADIVLDTAGKTPEQSKHELSKLLSTSNET